MFLPYANYLHKCIRRQRFLKPKTFSCDIVKQSTLKHEYLHNP